MSEDTLQQIKQAYGEQIMLQCKEDMIGESNAWMDNHLKTLLKRFEDGADFLSFIQYFIKVLKEENKSMINASFLSSNIKKFNMQLHSQKDDKEAIAKDDEEEEVEEDFIDSASLKKKLNEIYDSLEYIRNDVQEGFYDVGEIKLDSASTTRDVSVIKEVLDTLRTTKTKRVRTAEYQQVQEVERLIKEKNKHTTDVKKKTPFIANIHSIYIVGGIGCFIILLLFLLLLKV